MDVESSQEKLFINLGESFVSSLRLVLNKKLTFASLTEYLTPSCTWINPFISTLSEASEEIEKFSNFFNDTNIIVFSQRMIREDTIEINYQLSCWYPLPWRPRIIIPAVAELKISFLDGKPAISSITEKWEVSPLDILFKQIPPRWWDLWHIFSSPSPEYPPIQTIKKVRNNVQVRVLPQTVFMEVQWSGAAKVLIVLILLKIL